MANGNDFRETVESLFKGIDSFVAAKSVIGEPIHIGDTIIIPMADVSFGVGAGAFGNGNRNDGGGVGGRMSPCAVLVIQNGITKVVTIRDQDGLTKVLDLVPDIVNRFAPGGPDAE